MKLSQCPLCREQIPARIFGELDHRKWGLCAACGHAYASNYDAEQLTQLYVDNYYASADDPRIKEWIDLNMRSWQSLAAQLLSFAGEVKTLADIGAGTGGFLQAVREVMPTTELYAVESSEHACNSMRKRLPGVKFPFPCAEDLATTDHKFDCITILQCLEHVCEPTTILEKAYSSLNEGGLILIAVPNRYSYEVFLKGKAKSLCYSNATHLHFFTKATMQQCLKRAGFGQIQRLAQFGNGEYTGWRAVAQYALRKVGLSTELRYIARKV